MPFIGGMVEGFFNSLKNPRDRFIDSKEFNIAKMISKT